MAKRTTRTSVDGEWEWTFERILLALNLAATVGLGLLSSPTWLAWWQAPNLKVISDREQTFEWFHVRNEGRGFANDIELVFDASAGANQIENVVVSPIGGSTMVIEGDHEYRITYPKLAQWEWFSVRFEYKGDTRLDIASGPAGSSIGPFIRFFRSKEGGGQIIDDPTPYAMKVRREQQNAGD